MKDVTRFDWKRTIRINITALKILGLWPAHNDSYGCNLYTLYEIVVMVFFEIGFIFSQTVNLFFILDDLQAVTEIIFVSLMEMLAILKSYCLIKNMKMLKQLMMTVNSDLFQPKSLQQRDLIQPSLNAWKTIVSLFWFFTVGWLFFYCFCPIFDRSFRKYRLPFLAWYPYKTKTSPQYELTYLHQFIGITYLALVDVNIDSLIAALNMYIGAQFDILCDDLKNFHDSKSDTSADAKKKLKQCIQHHREILKFAEYANQFYNWLVFVEFFVGGFSIGLSMFQLTIVIPFSGEFYSFISYSNCISLQVFLYCWFGNEIEVKSAKLPYAVFASDWTSLPPEIKRDLVIFLLRIHRPLKMSAFGLFNLSLETFVKIMRTAWSYFALLRQVNSPK
ncbi:7tm 6 domain containing protein [Asbolus verrucosus]|uniref:Odorant receptor n=1 Tax=Asbolus verrucosus TaxID=1661398 RepID=A0A482VBI4_ASBVE|nr:7tm 6 domain containing protein [Asbolus verrucosus]